MVQITKSLSSMASAACLSTMVFMSSCSKEDAVTPSPEVAISKIESVGGSNLKINGLEIIPPTLGQPGIGSLPAGYTNTGSQLAIGLSNSRYLFGNSSNPWILAKNLAPAGAGTFLTLGATKSKSAYVDVAIKNLVAGKKYKFTYSISTLAVKNGGLGHTPYARDLFVFIKQGGEELLNEGISFIDRENQWITRSEVFTAEDVADTTSMLKLFLISESENISYGNIFIPKGAIQEVK